MELYAKIEQAIRNHDSFLSVPARTSQDNVYQCIRSIMRKNPDIFWFSHQWKYVEDEHIIHFHYTIDKESSLKAKAQIDDVVQNDFQIGRVFQLPVQEQAMYVYKWLALYCNYNIYSALNQTIFSVFVHRNSVCTGFAKAAQYLLKVLGIESQLVFGTLKNAEAGSRHCWLVVKINERWYHIDPTFAVPAIQDMLIKAGVTPVFGADGLVYNYFCCSAQTIEESRTIEDEGTLSVCTDTLDYKAYQDLQVTPHRPIPQGEDGVRGVLLTGKGTFSDVYLWHTANDSPKQVAKVFKNDPSHELLWHECRVMRELAASHHVIHICNVTSDQSALIIEQATPLADLLCCHYYQLSAKKFCLLLLDIVNGLKDCLAHGIYYRDIHINNIFRTSVGNYVLGDFGSCVWIDRIRKSQPSGLGSPWYMAPETYRSKKFTETSASYGVGMIAYFMLNELYPPLYKEYGKESLNKRLDGANIPSPLLLQKPSNGFEQQLTNVILKVLSYEERDRYKTLEELSMAIHNVLALVQDDFLLIEGGTSIRSTSFESKGVTKKNIRRFNFESTAINSPDILVSNGENEVTLVNADGDNSFDIIALDNNDGCIEEQDVVDISDTFTRIDDFASTAGGYDMYPDDVSFTGNSSTNVGEKKSATHRRIDDFATTERYIGRRNRKGDKRRINVAAIGSIGKENTLPTYAPRTEMGKSTPQWSKSLWSRIFKRNNDDKSNDVYSSIFAPAEVKPKSHMLVQVYLHLIEETETVKALALESDKNAERRDYIPLQCKLKKGDKVIVCLNIYGETLLKTYEEPAVWQGSFTKCSFDYFVPKDINVDELSCMAQLTVNGVPVGEMRFVTQIVEAPRNLNTEIIAHKYNKVFISYAHKDEAKVKSFHEGLKLAGIEHFFDRDYLQAGDVFPQVIQDYINTADLFVLFWSENASKSEYVEKERTQALLRAFPQVKPQQAAKLSIYPMSIEPRTELPADMRDYYHFGG